MQAYFRALLRTIWRRRQPASAMSRDSEISLSDAITALRKASRKRPRTVQHPPAPAQRQGRQLTNVRVNISNLPPVMELELRELFEKFGPYRIMVHHDQNGQPVGTADIYFRSLNAAYRLVNESVGMRIDGKLLKFYVLTNQVAHSAFYANRTRSVHHWAAKRRRVDRFCKQMSEEQLNAEIDAYMHTNQ